MQLVSTMLTGVTHTPRLCNLKPLSFQISTSFLSARAEHGAGARPLTTDSYSSTQSDEVGPRIINAAFLVAAFLVINLGYTAVDAWAPFEQMPLPSFLPFKDAFDGGYKLSILACLQGLEKGISLGWYNKEVFCEGEYFYLQNPTLADMHVVSPKFVAFRGPGRNRRDKQGTQQIPMVRAPKYYVEVFKEKDVSCIVRLNNPRHYSPTCFTNEGFNHYECCFKDCTTPSNELVANFLNITESARGKVAVHCRRGLGRTGTLIAIYCMKHHGFTATEAIGWLHLMRPGSIIGSQHQYLHWAESTKVWEYPDKHLPEFDGDLSEKGAKLVEQEVLIAQENQNMNDASLTSSSEKTKSSTDSAASSSPTCPRLSPPALEEDANDELNNVGKPPKLASELFSSTTFSQSIGPFVSSFKSKPDQVKPDAPNNAQHNSDGKSKHSQSRIAQEYTRPSSPYTEHEPRSAGSPALLCSTDASEASTPTQSRSFLAFFRSEKTGIGSATDIFRKNFLRSFEESGNRSLPSAINKSRSIGERGMSTPNALNCHPKTTDAPNRATISHQQSEIRSLPASPFACDQVPPKARSSENIMEDRLWMTLSKSKSQERKIGGNNLKRSKSERSERPRNSLELESAWLEKFVRQSSAACNTHR